MTIVNCGFTDCIYNKDKIYLDESWGERREE